MEDYKEEFSYDLMDARRELMKGNLNDDLNQNQDNNLPQFNDFGEFQKFLNSATGSLVSQNESMFSHLQTLFKCSIYMKKNEYSSIFCESELSALMINQLNDKETPFEIINIIIQIFVLFTYYSHPISYHLFLIDIIPTLLELYNRFYSDHTTLTEIQILYEILTPIGNILFEPNVQKSLPDELFEQIFEFSNNILVKSNDGQLEEISSWLLSSLSSNPYLTPPTALSLLNTFINILYNPDPLSSDTFPAGYFNSLKGMCYLFRGFGKKQPNNNFHIGPTYIDFLSLQKEMVQKMLKAIQTGIDCVDQQYTQALTCWTFLSSFMSPIQAKEYFKFFPIDMIWKKNMRIHSSPFSLEMILTLKILVFFSRKIPLLLGGTLINNGMINSFISIFGDETSVPTIFLEKCMEILLNITSFDYIYEYENQIINEVENPSDSFTDPSIPDSILRFMYENKLFMNDRFLDTISLCGCQNQQIFVNAFTSFIRLSQILPSFPDEFRSIFFESSLAEYEPEDCGNVYQIFRKIFLY